jgi:DNA-binding XRE family transcriptional regulator
MPSLTLSTPDFRTLRIAHGFPSQIALAMAIGSSPSTISRIELYDYIPQYIVRKKIAKAFKVEVHDIWPGVDDD